MPSGTTQSYLAPSRASIFRPYPGRYSIYPPVKDERRSRPEPMQVSELPRVAAEVLAVPGVSWLSRHLPH